MKYLDFLEKDILSLTQYSGDKSSGKTLSASSWHDDHLQIFYKCKFGTPDDTVIGGNTLGSLVHLGLEQLSSDNVETEKRFTLPFGDEWNASAMLDYINHDKKVIVDFKITKRYTLQKFNQDSGYAQQLRFQKMVSKLSDYKIFVAMFLKDYEGDFRSARTKCFNYVEIEDRNIKADVAETMTELNYYLDTDTEPPECKNLFWGREDGKNVRKRCKYYCNYSSICKYYKKQLDQDMSRMKLW
jgi:hypothetical protein